MTNKLQDQIKSLVIQQWLQGLSRDSIAANCGISTGAVTGIVNEWRQGLGSTTGTELRELAVTLKKVGINPAQCATGFRAAIAMTKLGVKEDDFESFMSDVYNRCSNIGLEAEKIASYLKDLLEFSRSVPFSRISGYVQQKLYDKQKLEEEMEKLKAQIGVLQKEISDSENLRNAALHDQKLLLLN
jgi:hypothetical protein